MAKRPEITAFSRLLAELLGEDRGAQTRFGKAVGHPRAFINQILHGARTPPLDEVEKWATKLNLEGRERQRFLDLAALAHLPSAIEARFLRIFAEHGDLIERYRQLGVPFKIPTAKVAEPKSTYSATDRHRPKNNKNQ